MNQKLGYDQLVVLVWHWSEQTRCFHMKTVDDYFLYLYCVDSELAWSVLASKYGRQRVALCYILY